MILYRVQNRFQNITCRVGQVRVLFRLPDSLATRQVVMLHAALNFFSIEYLFTFNISIWYSKEYQDHSLSGQGVWSSFAHSNPQRFPLKIPKIVCD